MLVCGSPGAARAAEDGTAASAAETCTLQPGATRSVGRVIDGETVQLDDGSEVRLIGALAPRAEDVGAVSHAWPAETEAIRLLTGLVLGRTVRLAHGARKFDRYGRYLAHLFVKSHGEDVWVQGEMLARGAARAYGVAGAFDCAAELRAHERLARDGRKGIWALRPYRALSAERTHRLMALRSRFAIVAGVVKQVARTKGAIYLNFGDSWKTNFTARIGKEIASSHPAFDRQLETLKDRAVEIRGWIERRNGPLIEIEDPSQIETVEGAGPLLSKRRESGVKPADASPSDDGAHPRAAAPGDAGDRPEEKEKRPADPQRTRPGALNL